MTVKATPLSDLNEDFVAGGVRSSWPRGWYPALTRLEVRNDLNDFWLPGTRDGEDFGCGSVMEALHVKGYTIWQRYTRNKDTKVKVGLYSILSGFINQSVQIPNYK